MAGSIEPLRRFIGELTGLLDAKADETTILERGGAALRALVASDSWLPDEFAEPNPDSYRQYLLYCDPWERFSVVSFVWGPGQRTPIHDHTVWGLIGMLRGAELARGYTRDPAGGRRGVAAGARRCDCRFPAHRRHPHRRERARRPVVDQHPRLWREYRRGRAACLCRRERRGQTICFGLRQPADAESVGPLDRDARPPRYLTASPAIGRSTHLPSASRWRRS
jgi:hypothetical protein